MFITLLFYKKESLAGRIVFKGLRIFREYLVERKLFSDYTLYTFDCKQLRQ